MIIARCPRVPPRASASAGPSCPIREGAALLLPAEVASLRFQAQLGPQLGRPGRRIEGHLAFVPCAASSPRPRRPTACPRPALSIPPAGETDGRRLPGEPDAAVHRDFLCAFFTKARRPRGRHGGDEWAIAAPSSAARLVPHQRGGQLAVPPPPRHVGEWCLTAWKVPIVRPNCTRSLRSPLRRDTRRRAPTACAPARCGPSAPLGGRIFERVGDATATPLASTAASVRRVRDWAGAGSGEPRGCFDLRRPTRLRPPAGQVGRASRPSTTPRPRDTPLRRWSRGPPDRGPPSSPIGHARE